MDNRIPSFMDNRIPSMDVKKIESYKNYIKTTVESKKGDYAITKKIRHIVDEIYKTSLRFINYLSGGTLSPKHQNKSEHKKYLTNKAIVLKFNKKIEHLERLKDKQLNNNVGLIDPGLNKVEELLKLLKEKGSEVNKTSVGDLLERIKNLRERFLPKKEGMEIVEIKLENKPKDNPLKMGDTSPKLRKITSGIEQLKDTKKIEIEELIKSLSKEDQPRTEKKERLKMKEILERTIKERDFVSEYINDYKGSISDEDLIRYNNYLEEMEEKILKYQKEIKEPSENNKLEKQSFEVIKEVISHEGRERLIKSMGSKKELHGSSKKQVMRSKEDPGLNRVQKKIKDKRRVKEEGDTPNLPLAQHMISSGSEQLKKDRPHSSDELYNKLMNLENSKNSIENFIVNFKNRPNFDSDKLKKLEKSLEDVKERIDTIKNKSKNTPEPNQRHPVKTSREKPVDRSSSHDDNEEYETTHIKTDDTLYFRKDQPRIEKRELRIEKYHGKDTRPQTISVKERENVQEKLRIPSKIKENIIDLLKIINKESITSNIGEKYVSIPIRDLVKNLDSPQDFIDLFQILIEGYNNKKLNEEIISKFEKLITFVKDEINIQDLDLNTINDIKNGLKNLINQAKNKGLLKNNKLEYRTFDLPEPPKKTEQLKREIVTPSKKKASKVKNITKTRTESKIKLKSENIPKKQPDISLEKEQQGKVPERKGEVESEAFPHLGKKAKTESKPPSWPGRLLKPISMERNLEPTEYKKEVQEHKVSDKVSEKKITHGAYLPEKDFPTFNEKQGKEKNKK